MQDKWPKVCVVLVNKKYITRFRIHRWNPRCNFHSIFCVSVHRHPSVIFQFSSRFVHDLEWMQHGLFEPIIKINKYVTHHSIRAEKTRRKITIWEWTRRVKTLMHGWLQSCRHAAVWFSLMKTKTKMVKNEKITNSLMKTKTKTKTKNRKRLKTKTKTKVPKQQNLSLNKSASIQYGANAIRCWIRD